MRKRIASLFTFYFDRKRAGNCKIVVLCGFSVTKHCSENVCTERTSTVPKIEIKDSDQNVRFAVTDGVDGFSCRHKVCVFGSIKITLSNYLKPCSAVWVSVYRRFSWMCNVFWRILGYFRVKGVSLSSSVIMCVIYKIEQNVYVCLFCITCFSLFRCSMTFL